MSCKILEVLPHERRGDLGLDLPGRPAPPVASAKRHVHAVEGLAPPRAANGHLEVRAPRIGDVQCFAERTRAGVSLVSSLKAITNLSFSLDVLQDAPAVGKTIPATYELFVLERSGGQVIDS